MIAPGGTADLVRGERFASLHILLLYADSNRFIFVDMACVSCHWRYLDLPLWFEFYDISCQWIVNFVNRLSVNREFFDRISPAFVTKLPPIRAAVGAWHAVNHQEDCRKVFDIRLLPGSGMSYGDNLEAMWAVHNRMGSMVAEMGIGTRAATIDEQFDDFNSKKELGMGGRFSHSDSFRMLTVSSIYSFQAVQKRAYSEADHNPSPRAA